MPTTHADIIKPDLLAFFLMPRLPTLGSRHSPQIFAVLVSLVPTGL